MLCCNWSQEMLLSSRMRNGGPNLKEERRGIKKGKEWQRTRRSYNVYKDRYYNMSIYIHMFTVYTNPVYTKVNKWIFSATCAFKTNSKKQKMAWQYFGVALRKSINSSAFSLGLIKLKSHLHYKTSEINFHEGWAYWKWKKSATIKVTATYCVIPTSVKLSGVKCIKALLSVPRVLYWQLDATLCGVHRPE